MIKDERWLDEGKRGASERGSSDALLRTTVPAALVARARPRARAASGLRLPAVTAHRRSDPPHPFLRADEGSPRVEGVGGDHGGGAGGVASHTTAVGRPSIQCAQSALLYPPRGWMRHASSVARTENERTEILLRSAKNREPLQNDLGNPKPSGPTGRIDQAEILLPIGSAQRRLPAVSAAFRPPPPSV